MRAGFVQFNSRLLDVEGNVERAFKLVGNKKADLIVFPELFNTGYNFRTRAEVAKVAETLPGGQTTEALKDFSRRKGSTVVAGLVERKGQSFYNSAVIVKNGRYVGSYRKVHLFFNEKKFFKRGNAFKVFGNLGVMICFDWYFPESARSLTLKGAEVIAHPSNLVMPHCPDCMKTRALENRVYIITADRVGVERGLRFIGFSQIINPKGEILYRSSGTREEFVTRDIDLKLARDKSINRRNNLLKDRAPLTYMR